jgi:hypothetical protein
MAAKMAELGHVLLLLLNELSRLSHFTVTEM